MPSLPSPPPSEQPTPPPSRAETLRSGLSRARVVVRDDGALLLRPAATFVVLAFVVGIAALVGAVVRFGALPLAAAVILLVMGILLPAVGFWLARTPEAQLVVGPHGISSPLLPHGGPIAWGDVAVVHAGGLLLTTFSVSVWRNPADQRAGTRTGLRLPPGLAPMTGRRLDREVEQRRARYSTPDTRGRANAD